MRWSDGARGERRTDFRAIARDAQQPLAGSAAAAILQEPMSRHDRPSGLLLALAVLAVVAVGSDLVRRGLVQRRAGRSQVAAAHASDTIASAGGSTAPTDSSTGLRARIRARIAEEEERTYITSTLIETDSTIRRWPDARSSRP